MAKRLAKELEVPLAFLFCEDENMAELLVTFDRLSARKGKQAKVLLQELAGAVE